MQRSAIGHLVSCILVGGLLIAPTPRTFGQTGNSTTGEPEAEKIQQWIRALDSDSYTTRRIATERLTLAGQAAIDPVAAAMDEGSLETIVRCVRILHQLAVSADDVSTQSAAYEALRRAAKRPNTAAGGRASAALATINDVRYRQTRHWFEQQGAVIVSTNVQIPMRYVRTYTAVILGPTWRGTVADLDRLRWLTTAPSDEAEGNWMVALEGPQVTDQWLDAIKDLERVGVVQIKSAQITDEGIRHLAEMPELEILEVLYSPITNESLRHFENVKKLSRVRLFGTQATPAAAEAFQARFANVEVDLRQGAFLGIACDDHPCQVTTVRDGTAAAENGLQIGDVITHFNGQPVNTMDELTAEIAKNSAGDEVTIDLLRGEEKMTKKIKLGSW